MERFDKYWIGIVLGLIMPAAFIWIYINQFNLWYSIQTFGMALSQTYSKLLFLSVFPNMAFIFVFYTMDMWCLSKGVLIGAFPYIIASAALTI
ncbi:MAG: hypothetical protein J6W92_02040 [Paludibacteraceae bacterium]|jgi:hypothetical protein|nr:hypothetical protein [Paludibacteraceae bacterium]MBP5641833.1 hypothetical protein [Paludibacteraceae bacterium]